MDAGIYPADPERDGKYQQDGDARTVLYRFSRADCARRKCVATQQPPKVLHTTTYQYDDRHRLVRKTVNGGMMVMLAVDYRYTDGRLSRMADSDSTSTLRWDEKGRWISRETTSRIMDHARPVV
jgi:hypothetical protein